MCKWINRYYYPLSSFRGLPTRVNIRDYLRLMVRCVIVEYELCERVESIGLKLLGHCDFECFRLLLIFSSMCCALGYESHWEFLNRYKQLRMTLHMPLAKRDALYVHGASRDQLKLLHFLENPRGSFSAYLTCLTLLCNCQIRKSAGCACTRYAGNV